MLKGMVYRSILRKLKAAKERLFVKSPEERGGILWGQVTDDMVADEAHVPRWFARWTRNWERDKKKGLL
jgi:hypothetical protein